MKHRLVKQLKLEIKQLKLEIKQSKNKKPKYQNPMAELIDQPIDIESLKNHFKDKYAH